MKVIKFSHETHLFPGIHNCADRTQNHKKICHKHPHKMLITQSFTITIQNWKVVLPTIFWHRLTTHEMTPIHPAWHFMGVLQESTHVHTHTNAHAFTHTKRLKQNCLLLIGVTYYTNPDQADTGASCQKLHLTLVYLFVHRNYVFVNRTQL